jgi:hypothetical protein
MANIISYSRLHSLHYPDSWSPITGRHSRRRDFRLLCFPLRHHRWLFWVPVFQPANFKSTVDHAIAVHVETHLYD